MTVTVNSNGQITIPAKIRRQMGIHTWSKIDFLVWKDSSVKLIPKKELSVYDLHTLHESKIVLTDEELQEATSHAFRPSDLDQYGS